MKPILEIQHISKKFMINREQLPYLNLRESLSSFFKRSSNKKSEFWALDDISFNVNPGESVGVIGKNGAGKSTLLKILSKITPPTSGKIISRGRIASLLEVGTGFHPELSGRENVYMNGSILGMRRHEIIEKFDEIVDFAGVSKFIDSPLKHYSSGMQLRLAFAVAAFLENEILIIDEVLAVGDADFQKKCIGKMENVSKSGRTVIFVSHNTESLSVLCQKGILLDAGKMNFEGNILDVINKYSNLFKESFKVWDALNRPGDNVVRINEFKIVNTQNEQIKYVKREDSFGLYIEFEVLEDGSKPAPNFHFFNTNNVYCFVSITNVEPLRKGIYNSITWIPENFLNNQTYRVGVALTTLSSGKVHLYEQDVINIEVVEDKIKRLNEYGGPIPGVIRPEFENEINQLK